MRRLLSLTPLLLLLFLFGCGPKQMEPASPLLGGVDDSLSITVIAGESTSLPITLPALKKVEPALDIDAKEPLSVSQTDQALSLTCETPGTYPLTLTVSAKGYETMTASYSVEVLPRPMALSLLDADQKPVTEVSLSRGETIVLTVVAEPGADVSVTNPASSSCDAALTGETLTITANEANDSSVTLRAALSGYADAELTLPISVTAVAAEFSIPQSSLSGLTGETLTLSSTIDPEGTLSASCDSALTATVNGGKLSFTTMQPGVYQVILTVEAPGDLPSSKTISVAFTQPKVSLTAPQSIAVSAGSSTTATVSATQGASIWATASGNITASIDSNGALTVSADQKGSGVVTVGASKEGFSDASVTIPVTVSVALPSVSSKYSSEAQDIVRLVNQERAANGLKALTYRSNLEGLAQLRAKEAASYWSHTRPDGREFNTVFTDFDLHYVGEGENLFAANALDVDIAMDEWMNSPDHRANILRNNVDGISVGIVLGSDGDYYYCQLFVTD